jgi:hypothetical protein
MSLQWMHTNAPCLHTALVYTARQAKQHAQPWTVHGTAQHGMPYGSLQDVSAALCCAVLCCAVLCCAKDGMHA